MILGSSSLDTPSATTLSNVAVTFLGGVVFTPEATVLSDQPNGRFAHILDPEGTEIELWQPRPMPA